MFSNKKYRICGALTLDAGDKQMELTERQVKKIPFQTLGVLLMFEAGIDLKSKMALNTYYAHKRILKTHGFDITQKKEKKEPKRYTSNAVLNG